MSWTAPRTWVAAEVVSASIGNTHWRDNFKAIGDAWASYTPTWSASGTAVAIGNGTQVGGYINPGKLVIFRAKITMGSTTTYGTGSYRIALPVSMNASDPGRFMVTLLDSSAGATYQGVTYNVSGTLAPIAADNGTAGGALAGITPTVPFTFATSDTIEATGMYEAA